MKMKFSPISRFVVRCLYGSCLALGCAAQQPQASPAATAFAQIRLNTAYDDSSESLLLLAAVARYVPVRQIPVAAGDDLDKLFVREYGFGHTDLPKSYALLLRVILEKNHLSRPEDLRPGVLIIPAVPTRAWMRWGRNNPLNYIANMILFRADSAVAASSSTNRKPTLAAVGLTEGALPDVAYKEDVPSDQPRPTAPSALLVLELGVRQVASFVESKIFPPGTVTAATFPLPVQLADESKCDTEPASRDHATLTPAQRARIAQLLTQGSQRSPVVFILDTGWPSLAAYRESVGALHDILDTVWRSQFGVGFPKSQPMASLPAANNDHCRCIERGLRELRALDQDVEPAKRVRIVYVPLTREQGADSVLTDLLLTSTLLDRQSKEHVEINSKIIQGSRKEATDLVKNHFPEKWAGEEVQTDKSLLDAILSLGQAYAEASKTVFFVSESWTVRHPDWGGEYYVQYQNPQYGLVTAATGNDPNAPLLDFAQRSPNSKDTMAVINMTAAGVDPDSTLIEQRNIDESLAAGFDGYVTDDVFGTSFSAPRIAWFLAAGEAVRTQPLDLHYWGVDLSLMLKRLRDPNATGYQKLLFNPIRYIEAQAGVTETATH
jgi:hypothetical protein